MKIRSVSDVNKLEGKKVLFRADLNVPIKENKILDDFKITRQVTDIKYLLNNDCKIIILTHLGQPKPGSSEKKFSVEPLAKKLSNLLNQPIKFINESIGLKVGTAISQMKNKDIILLENIRLVAGEENNSIKLGKELASLADIYVNNAFAVDHRAQASLCAVTKYIPSYGGQLLCEEINNLDRLNNPRKPLAVVFGGAKLETKIKIIKKFLNKAEYILIGGALANNFLAAHGLEIGSSLSHKKSIFLARQLIKSARFREKEAILLPVDAVVSSRARSWQPVVKNIKHLEKGDYIFDIGPKTINLYAKIIKKAATIIWNGPMGVFEERPYSHGTISLGTYIAARSKGYAYSVVGGGETVEALKMTKMIDYIDWVSTGGGAMLAYLGGENMPGLKGISTD